MGKNSKNDISWTRLSKKAKDILKLADELKTLNETLDNHIGGASNSLYTVFQCKSALNFYSTMAGHVDNNYKKVDEIKAWANAIISASKYK